MTAQSIPWHEFPWDEVSEGDELQGYVGDEPVTIIVGQKIPDEPTFRMSRS